MPKEAKKEKEKQENLEKLKLHCNSCKKTHIDNFYKSNNKRHSNGFLPYCRDCLEKIYIEYFTKYLDVEISLYLFCRAIDIPFLYKVMDVAQNSLAKEKIKNKDFKDTEIYRLYIQFLNNKLREVDAHLTFDDSDVSLSALKQSTNDTDIEEKIDGWRNDDKTVLENELKELRKRFGEYKDEELLWLRDEYNDWDRGNTLNTVALRKLTEDICKTRLSIRQSEKSDEIKRYSDILKGLLDQTGLKPISSRDVTNKNTIGMLIEDLEKDEPAEFLELKETYKDRDNYEKYYRIYFVAPMKRSLGNTSDSDVIEMEEEMEKEGLKLSKTDLQSVGIDAGE